MNKFKIGIIGATGYAGVELVRLLLSHPYAEITAVSSMSYEGKKISEVYPNLKEVCDMQLRNDDIVDLCDVVFTSLPHGLSEKFAKKCVEKGVKMIDLGADFRLDDGEEYAKWYGKKYEEEQLHSKSLYCIPELHRSQYKNQPIIGNPGCYPTSVALGLAPSIKSGLVKENTVVIDSKSGVTGAGRGLADNTHYPNCNEAFSPYKVASHRHTPEIEQTLSKLQGKKVNVTFVPHLLPVNRGIVSTIYYSADKKIDAKALHEIYKEFYKDEKFVRICELGEVANLRNVKYSNYCDISLHYDEHTGRVIIVSTIDNMVKGAAGQAIQNMNILFGLDEACGLNYVPPAF
ncbi:MAG: N-acetyl-gamma-glutamyl-phosphate reductase [Clostridia bacterium]|nr:N-acetyl-gamma-glutamyl-phosphate reductase [Clostridia bacterium]MDE7329277.1 N-acetyl-gamma-glutamyl-phosphate reductase [Clostridia bacterium]